MPSWKTWNDEHQGEVGVKSDLTILLRKEHKKGWRAMKMRDFEIICIVLIGTFLAGMAVMYLWLWSNGAISPV